MSKILIDEATVKLVLEALKSMTKTLAEHQEQTTFYEDEAMSALKALAEQPAQQEPDELIHIGEQDFLGDVNAEAWRSLIENRGGCRCFLSPPCGACSNPISEQEMNEVGYTYTTPQAPAAQQEPVAWMQDSIELYVQDRPGASYTIPLYTTPQAQRTWVGLTEEEKTELRRETYALPLLLMEAVEARLREKNGGAA